MGKRPRTYVRRGLNVLTAATLALVPGGCTDGDESGPKPTATSEAPAPPVKSFDELTKRTAEAITCMMTSDKARIESNNEGGLMSAPGYPDAQLYADQNPWFNDGLGLWRGSWWDSSLPQDEEGPVSIVSVEGFVPPDSLYWQDPQLTLAGVQAGASDVKGFYLSAVVLPFEIDSDGVDGGRIGYVNTSPAERDPAALKVSYSDSNWQPATEADVDRLEQDVNQALGTLMTQSGITNCLARP